MKKAFISTPANEALRERIKIARKICGVTVAQIAEKVGTYRPTISNQLTGKHSIDIMVVLAIAQLCPNISAEWLLRGEGNIEKQ